MQKLAIRITVVPPSPGSRRAKRRGKKEQEERGRTPRGTAAAPRSWRGLSAHCMTSFTQDPNDPTVFRCELHVGPVLHARGIENPTLWIQQNRTEANQLFRSLLAQELYQAPFQVPNKFVLYYSYVLPDGTSFHQRVDGGPEPGRIVLSPLYEIRFSSSR
jgi:hypothetical protein